MVSGMNILAEAHPCKGKGGHSRCLSLRAKTPSASMAC